MWATLMSLAAPCTTYICVLAASSSVRAVPAAPSPAAAKASRVAAIPAPFLSTLWFDAVEQPSQPAAARPGTSSGGEANMGYPEGSCPGGVTGTSIWHNERSAPSTYGTTGAINGKKSIPADVVAEDT